MDPKYCSDCAAGYQINETDYTCVKLPAHCVSFISDPTNCEECEDGYLNNEGCESGYSTTLDDGKCYEYTKITGYDEVDYGCIEFKIDGVNEMVTDVELYEPEDGVCENPYLSNGVGIMVVGICLTAILLL
ncbi:hypothetical protein QTN25_004639 [Entamoeba marina]